ncbi:MAG: glycosyltransferase family 2 protein [Candidatus Binatia bacterium]
MRPPGPLVSVIIPAFNCASFINDTLESVYQQTYTNWEIILIDDGSTDETRSVLEAHMKRIRYLYQENKGTAAARNTGLSEARGELIAFLDNDDLWLPEKLEMQVRAMHTWSDCGLVFTNGVMFDESGILIDSLISRRLKQWIEGQARADSTMVKGWIFRQLLFGNLISSASGVLAKKSCLEKVGGFDDTIPIADDYDLWLRVAQRYPIVLIQSCLYLWRYRQDSQSGAREDRHHQWTKASVVVLEKHWRSAPAEIRAVVRRNLSRMYWHSGRGYFDRNRFREARKMFLRCLHHNRVFVPAMLFLLASQFSPSFINTLRIIKRQVSRGMQGALSGNIHR